MNFIITFFTTYKMTYFAIKFGIFGISTFSISFPLTRLICFWSDNEFHNYFFYNI
jgi:hypothetical protein